MSICGPSEQQKEIAAQEQNFEGVLQSNYNSRFAAQTSIINQLTQALSPIVAAGPDQLGFTAAEAAALNTQAINSAGAAARNAQQAAGLQPAASSSTGLTSGIQKAIRSGINSTIASGLANTQENIVQADDTQGLKNYQGAMGGFRALSGNNGPLGPSALSGLSDSAITSGKNAFGSATQINTENNAALATLGGLTSALTGGFGNLDTTGSSTGGEQALNFLAGLS